MVDIHCHIVPGMDDGAQTLEEALEMIRMEVEGGTTAFVCSPHVYEQVDLKRTQSLPERISQLQQSCTENGIAVELYSGAEVYPFSQALQALDKGFPLTSGNHGKHMLVDLPMGELPLDFDSLLFELLARGVTPIIAHPERNAVFQGDPEKMFDYRERGIACQINAGSLWGRYGEKAEDVALFYLQRHIPYFLASDAHKPRPGGHLNTAIDLASETVDRPYLLQIATDTGRCIAHGETLPEIPIIEPEETGQKKSWLRKFFGG